ncbi:MAG: hypothetical protein JWM95_1559 [Gemmatimonadetes bacterium]|nr:hypothetical protein [Gemmatimonadota bacterium]
MSRPTRSRIGRDQVSRMAKALGEKAKLVVLARREIENYMAIPEVLVEFIALKRRLANIEGPAPTVHAIKDALEQAAAELKPLAIEFRVAKEACAPIHCDRKAVLDQNNDLSVHDRLQKEWRANVRDSMHYLRTSMQCCKGNCRH